MMKKLLFATMALCLVMLAGCATSPPPAAVPLAAAAVQNRAVFAATLARVGTCEVDVAADYSQLIVSRQVATNLLTSKAMSVDVAKQVQAQADAVRADLDAACPSAADKLKPERLAAARTRLKTIAQLLEKKP